MNKIGVAVIGASPLNPGWDVAAHIPAIQSLPEFVRVSGDTILISSKRISLETCIMSPDHLDPDNTSPFTLLKAARIGEAAGLRYVYAGNLPGRVWKYENTFCPSCKALFIARFGFHVRENHVTPAGTCPSCHTHIPGIWS